MPPPSREATALLFPLLEPPETKPELPEDLHRGLDDTGATLSESFRHSGWHHNRQLVYDSLRRTFQPESRLEAFRKCGAFAFIYQSTKPPFDYRLGGSSCRDRFCVPCARDRSRVLATNVLNALAGNPVRFLTLTLKVNDGPLSTQIDRLYSCFTALRARSFWRKRVNGGCAFTEVKWSEKRKGWNVHVHCMLHGLYIPKSDLWRAWFAITGDSMIVDIRLIHNQQGIARYVTKYVSKPFSNSFINRSQHFDELVYATHGRRLCITFGDWRGIKLSEPPEPGDWINIGTLHEVATRAIDGDDQALRAIRYVCQDRADEILARVRRSRAPPIPSPLDHQQTYFQFPWANYSL